jgi:hypothetical protein
MSEEYEPAPLPALPEERRRRPEESLDEYIDRLWPEARQAIARSSSSRCGSIPSSASSE